MTTDACQFRIVNKAPKFCKGTRVQRMLKYMCWDYKFDHQGHKPYRRSCCIPTLLVLVVWTSHPSYNSFNKFQAFLLFRRLRSKPWFMRSSKWSDRVPVHSYPQMVTSHLALLSGTAAMKPSHHSFITPGNKRLQQHGPKQPFLSKSMNAKRIQNDMADLWPLRSGQHPR